jgi:hypothetical protein
MRVRIWVVTLGTVASLLTAGCQPIQPPAEGEAALATPPAVEEAETMTETAEITETVGITEPAEPVAGDVMTETEEAGAGVEITASEEVTGAEEMTATEQVTGSEAVTGDQGLILPDLAAPDFVAVAGESGFTAPESIPAGWTRVVLQNDSPAPQDIVLVKLAEGRTADDVLAAVTDPEAPIPEWVELYGGTAAEPGMSSSYLVNLTPGNYVYFSFGEGETPAAAEGLIDTLTVTEADSAAEAVELPQASVAVDLLDFSFAVSDTLPAGEQLFAVTNSGQQPHHLIIFRLREGFTFADFQAFLTSEGEPEGEPPADEAGYSGELSPGVELYFAEDLTPGHYIFICFLPSPDHEGAPHFALGMVREVVVE